MTTLNTPQHDTAPRTMLVRFAAVAALLAALAAGTTVAADNVDTSEFGAAGGEAVAALEVIVKPVAPPASSDPQKPKLPGWPNERI